MSRLLVLLSRLVNSVKLSLFVLDVDRRFSAFRFDEVPVWPPSVGVLYVDEDRTS
jgi:hypothetical protein